MLALSLTGIAAASTAAAAAPEPASPTTSVLAPRPTNSAVDVQTYINAYRRRAGVPPVSLSWQLNKATAVHATDMARRRYMTHIGSDGSNAGIRIDRTGYYWWVWGENVAAGQVTASQVVWSWLNSPSHRAIILDRRYVNMGLARVAASDGTIYWCLNLATR